MVLRMQSRTSTLGMQLEQRTDEAEVGGERPTHYHLLTKKGLSGLRRLHGLYPLCVLTPHVSARLGKRGLGLGERWKVV